MKRDPTKDNATGQGGEVDTANLSSSDSSSLSSRERRLLNVLATCGETSRHDLDRMARVSTPTWLWNGIQTRMTAYCQQTLLLKRI